MTRIEDYRTALRALAAWEPYLVAESRLPGPRGNLELAQAVADEGDAAIFRQLLEYDPQQAPTNTPGEFLAFCGVLGLGKLLAQGDLASLDTLRAFASDPRWRVREAVAMALQRWGVVDMAALLNAMMAWRHGNALEQRAAAAALCEPKLLGNPDHAEAVLHILDDITTAIPQVADRKSDAFKALRKGLGYCWSVAAMAAPGTGKRLMEKWLAHDDPDIRWMVRENLRKKRLTRMDPAWVATSQAQL